MCLHVPGGAKGVNSLSGEALNVGTFYCDPQLQIREMNTTLNRRLMEWISERNKCVTDP